MRAGLLSISIALGQAAAAQSTAGPQPIAAPARAPSSSATAAPVVAAERAQALAAGRSLREIPLDKGLPMIVRAGLAFIDVHSVNENEGAFNATVDMRLRWEDPRLRYAREQAPRGFYEFRGRECEEKLGEIWSPTIRILSLASESPIRSNGLRIFPDGWVELLVRTTATFKGRFDAGAFPFDSQQLSIELASDKENADQVGFQFLQSDLNFSGTKEGIEIDGWTIGLVSLQRLNVAGWYGENYSGVTVGLEIKRQWGKVAAPIFIPLLASLLIPLLAIWMNGVEDGSFKVEAFELANVIVGGLFAVIALNFTVNAEYRLVASGDNTVTRLFALNYTALAAALCIVVFLYRFNVPRALFGRYVQEQFFRYLSWAVPLLAFATASAFILVSVV